MRIRVSISTQKPLRRVVKMQSKEGPISYRVGYERLPIYCFKCGTLGHLRKSCPSAHNEEVDKNDPYGSWLRAESPLKKLSLKEKEKSHQLSKLWEEVQAGKAMEKKKVKDQQESITEAEKLSEDLLVISINDSGTVPVMNPNEEHKTQDLTGEQEPVPPGLQIDTTSQSAGNKQVTKLGRKWHRIERRGLEGQSSDLARLEFGKRGALDDMDIDENQVGEKRQKDFSYSIVDGEVADLVKEQGR
ncbi:unnamed protein product [Linum trigynum]